MSDQASLRVLVVEDELLIRWSIAETLTAAGHSVVEAADAASARGVLHDTDGQLNVVLLDLRLPDSNDLGLLSDVRRLAPRSAVVMMTAYGTPDIVSRARELGAYTVLNKPFDLGEIEPLLTRAYQDRPERALS